MVAVPAGALVDEGDGPVSVSVSTDVSKAEWDGYVSAHADASVYHQWEWRRVYEAAFGHRSEYLAARDAKGRIAGVLPLIAFEHRLLGRFMVSLPFVNYGGVIADHVDVGRALVLAARERASIGGLSHVELRHGAPQFEELPRRSHKVAMTLALKTSADEAWEALDRKVRNQIRKATKSGLASEAGGEALLSDFYAVFAENMRDLGTPVYPKQWFAEILRRFPDQSGIVVVRDGQRPVAAAITLTHRSQLEVPSAGSLRSYRTLCPNMLLYWRIMQDAIGAGLRVLDFGRSTSDEGTFRFKEQWGATPAPLTWEYILLSRRSLPDRSPKSARMRPAIAVWKRLPLAVANRIGPAIVRYLP
jgi:FemAB-related protein (PEP-CTERM system-associated)